MEDDLEKVKNASSQSELLDNFRLFGKNTSDLINQAAKRQNELKDPRLRDDLASARAVLKKNSMMLLTASKVGVGGGALSAVLRNIGKIAVTSSFTVIDGFGLCNVRCQSVIKACILFLMFVDTAVGTCHMIYSLKDSLNLKSLFVIVL